MKRFQFQQGDFYISEQRLREIQEYDTPEEHFRERLNLILKEKIDPLEWEYVKTYEKIMGKPLAMIEAHGSTREEEWKFYDGQKGEQERSLQRLIRTVDRRYTTIIIAICNPGNHTIQSRNSLLLIPDRNLDFGVLGEDDEATNATFTLIDPKKGELSDYVIEFELKKLKQRLNPP